jgi:hypothetical protein
MLVGPKVGDAAGFPFLKLATAVDFVVPKKEIVQLDLQKAFWAVQVL